MELLEDTTSLRRKSRQNFDVLQSLISERVQERRKHRKAFTDEVIRIPVVVHVIHNRQDQQIGGVGNPNISLDQIQSQIRILNEDYRRIEGTPGFNTNPIGVDTQIEFYLAEEDPLGNSTNGVTRNYFASKSEFNTTSDLDLLSTIAVWPTTKYLNVWVSRLSNNFLGVAQFPSVVGMPGLDDTEAELANTDGVFIDFRSFGDRGAVEAGKYAYGRTATHEIGHWLGLLHTWGDRYCGTDYCEDTPTIERSNNSAIDCRDVMSNCRGEATRNMIENYMDYSPDRCMTTFTYNQWERMQAVWELSPRRKSLWEHIQTQKLDDTPSLTITIVPNPIQGRVLRFDVQMNGRADVEYGILDANGRPYSTYFKANSYSKTHEISIPNLPSGVYFLRVKTGANEQKISRFVVN